MADPCFLYDKCLDGIKLAPGCVQCATCGVVVWEAEKEGHECWCLECRHPKGPIARPKGMKEDGYVLIWMCPCECHKTEEDKVACVKENG